MDTLLTPLMQSPRLPAYVQQLSDYLKAEQQKRAEFYRTIRDDEKAEFINGEIVCHSPAKEKHNLIVQNLTFLFLQFVRTTKAGTVRSEKALVRLPRNDFEPDICFFRKEVADTFTGETMFYSVPDFVVEVLIESTEKRDRGIKMEDYALNGVQEYWLVSPDRQEVEQYILEGNVFRLKEKIAHGTVCCVVLSGLEIPVQAIFE
jgi:Uma2 family endonuclease